MAIPSEYNHHPDNIGFGITNPAKVILPYIKRKTEETIGPLTNSKTTAVLHPDMCDSDPDRGRNNSAEHVKQFSTWFPGQLAGSNYVAKGSDMNSPEAYIEAAVLFEGEQATYMADQYTQGDDPQLFAFG